MNWQPIETAPKDETDFLGWSEKDGIVIWRWLPRVIDGRDRGCFVNISDEWETFEEPTRWMPLPAPPEQN